MMETWQAALLRGLMWLTQLSFAKHPVDFLGVFQCHSLASCILYGNSATRLTINTLIVL